jgi:Domain of unknown function (DUF4351)
MEDHDQRFKTLIQEFFADFLRLFFGEWAARLDCDAVEWLPQEVFPDPPDGPRRVLDLVAKLPTRESVPGQRPGEPDHFLALVHIEIESPDRATPLRPRIYRDYGYLRDKYGLPVLPIGLFLKVGLDGLGIDVYEEHFWELRPIRFEYLYVGLPGLDAVQYVQSANWLGVALSALMKIPRERVAWLGAEALRRLTEAPLTDRQRFLLGECVTAYLPMDDSQRQDFEDMVAAKPFDKVQAMNKTYYEQGIEKGIEKGEILGQQKLIRDLLEDRFGPLSQQVVERLMDLSAERLNSLGRAVLRAPSLKELGLVDE